MTLQKVDFDQDAAIIYYSVAHAAAGQLHIDIQDALEDTQVVLPEPVELKSE